MVAMEGVYQTLCPEECRGNHKAVTGGSHTVFNEGIAKLLCSLLLLYQLVPQSAVSRL
jgi:hypothetical protein